MPGVTVRPTPPSPVTTGPRAARVPASSASAAAIFAAAAATSRLSRSAVATSASSSDTPKARTHAAEISVPDVGVALHRPGISPWTSGARTPSPHPATARTRASIAAVPPRPDMVRVRSLVIPRSLEDPAYVGRSTVAGTLPAAVGANK